MDYALSGWLLVPTCRDSWHECANYLAPISLLSESASSQSLIASSNYCKIQFRLPNVMEPVLYENIFHNRLSVEHPDYTVAELCIMFAMCYHDDGCPLFIQIGQQFHHFAAIG